MPYFSIVIPSLNEEKFLPLLLKDLENQSLKDFEVVHIDGMSTDKTRKRSGEFQNRLALKFDSVKANNPSLQRNTGADHAEGQWIIFMDADNRIKSDFLAALKRQLTENPKVKIFSCLVDTSRYPRKYKKYARLFNLGMSAAEKILPQAPGSLIGIDRKISSQFEFDTEMQSAEDRAYIRDVIKKGYKFKLFREPRYLYSFRRVDKEGTIRMAFKSLYNTIRFMSGYKFRNEKEFYPMEGGGQYDQRKTE